MVFAREPAPRRLDRGLAGVAGHAEHVVWVPFGHGASVSRGRRADSPRPTIRSDDQSKGRPHGGAHRRTDRSVAIRAGVQGAGGLSAPASAGATIRARSGSRFEELTIPSGGVDLPAWWIPARDGAPGPAVLLIHGWESARDRTLPNALILNAIGMHVLTLDVRGHGANPPEELPLTAGEFGEDALAGVQTLLARPDVTAVGILGHSMGAIGALLAAAAEPRVAAVVAASTPADPYRLTRQTFRLAKLPLPGPFAWPLAWLTTHVFLQPRGHTVQVRVRRAGHRAIRRPGAPHPRRRGSRRAVQPPRDARERRPAGARGRAAAPRTSRSSRFPAGSTAGCTSSRPTAARSRASSPRRSTVRSAWTRPRRSPAPRPRHRLPQREHPFSSIKPEEGGLKTLAKAIRMAGGSRIEQIEPEPATDEPAERPKQAMTDVWSAIRTKRMVRTFADRPLAARASRADRRCRPARRQLEEHAAMGLRGRRGASDAPTAR